MNRGPSSVAFFAGLLLLLLLLLLSLASTSSALPLSSTDLLAFRDLCASVRYVINGTAFWNCSLTSCSSQLPRITCVDDIPSGVSYITEKGATFVPGNRLIILLILIL